MRVLGKHNIRRAGGKGAGGNQGPDKRKGPPRGKAPKLAWPLRS